MSHRMTRTIRPLPLLLALGLAVACASAPGTRTAQDGTEPTTEATGATAARADEGPTCQGDCWLRVDNRLRRDGEVSTQFEPAVSILGIVRANRTEVFRLEDFTGEHIEIWVRDTETRDLIGLDCIRQFRPVQGRKQGRMVLGEGGAAGSSGC